MEVLRLVLVDDYRMVTEAMASRLSASADLWVAGCSQTDDPRLPEIVRWLRRRSGSVAAEVSVT